MKRYLYVPVVMLFVSGIGFGLGIFAITQANGDLVRAVLAAGMIGGQVVIAICWSREILEFIRKHGGAA